MTGTLFYYMYSVNDEHKLSVSILIPLTGLKAIDETIESVINQVYPVYEVIVLRNGIKDFEENTDYIESNNPLLPYREVFIRSKGKGNALNIGIGLSSGELICVLDADCVLDNKALFNIICHFDDENVMAAGARLEVMQKNGKLLERVQSYEYIRTFLVTRRLLSSINAQCLISGAFGVFRKSSLLEVRGYDTDTVGEDMELVLKLQNSGLRRSKGRIVHDSDSVCYTGVPETLKRLFRQRDRWQRGLLDCLFKHSNMLFNPMFGLLGMLVLPWQFIFELLGPLWSLLYFVCPMFRDMFPKSWFVYFVYVGFEFFITVYAVFISVNRNVFKLLKRLPEIFVFTFMGILIQIPVSIARLWGMISFLWRRLVW